ncbi:MAG: glucose-6-phosphate isomerase, partial [bacterium]|nr:glucose-6-phosphate isomerase [bacterium]
YMRNIKFQSILNSELDASALALGERGRSNGCLVIPKIDAYYIGQLIQFFEIATVYMGGLLNINVFDQPGVELGKQNLYALLKRKGYELRESELKNLQNKAGKRIV